jgi:crotonobetainyl-CoA:carnitine CoA-transferase CaiB-like acyl-CoA transferase
MRKALEGIRILDLAWMLPGPYATMILADLGAEIIKIEDTLQGDPTRWSPRHLTSNNSPFLTLNRGKKSLALDLKSSQGAEIFRKLVPTADVLLEGFRPGVMDRLGFSYAGLRASHNRLIYCSISGYGQDGPLRERGGHDVNYLALAGVLGLQTDQAGTPVLSGIQIADLGGALFAVIAILAALAARERTGEGQQIDVSMMDTGIALMPIAASRFFGGEDVPLGARLPLSGGLACYNIYATADGRHLSVGALEPKFWESFCKVIGRADLVARQMEGRESQQAMIREVGEIIRRRTLAEWTGHYHGTDACVEPVLALDEAFGAPQTLHRKMVVETEHPREGKVRQLSLPFKLSGTPPQMGGPAPLLGEHTREILGSLGYSPDEIQRLIDSGIVHAALSLK